jgi:small subunit ribosomal protein S27
MCYNLLMDHFIKKEDFASAAKVASFMMLQEEFENPISNALAIYSCHNYLKNPDTWIENDPETLIEKPKEEIKIRVKYLRNPYFDDHFDLWKPSDLVGKTLWWVGLAMDNTLGRSCQLRGLVLYNKYTEAIAALKKWKEEGIEKVIYKNTLSLIKNDRPEMFISGENSSKLEKELQSLMTDIQNSNFYEGNLDEDITNLVKKAVDTHSEEDIKNQIQVHLI